jgi:YVTN family beta-propeller protein
MLAGDSPVLGGTAAPGEWLSPSAMAVTKDGRTLFIACATASQVLRWDTAERKVVDTLSVPGAPLGLALSLDEGQLFVTCGRPVSTVYVVGVAPGSGGGGGMQIRALIPAGHTAMSPVLSLDGKTLYVCYRFDNSVGVIDLAARKEVERIPVQREPVAADLSRDGQFLLVANHLHNTRADTGFAAAVVSVIDLAAGEVVKEIPLPNGSGSLQDLRVSPDGRYAVVSHVLGRFNRTAALVRRGWMNVNALTIIDVRRQEVYNTVLLDDLDRGAANPWGLAWTADGATVAVAHAGTHEVSLVDFPMVLEQLPDLAKGANPAGEARPADRTRAEEADYIPFLNGSHPRVKLPPGDLGPRAVVIAGHTAYVANYFSDTLSIIDLANPQAKVESVALGPKREMSAARRGEFYFNDADLCFQGWQSCASCHPGGGRSDALNWDLLNDGEGNPKNTKSLLLAHRTPPAMWLGVRETAEVAVRAGIRHILFTTQPEAVASAMDEYLKSLEPVPSPHLVDGKLSPAAERGRAVFSRAGCAACHSPGLYTDLHAYDVGTCGPRDKPTDKFYTPTLVELWRTAPYLHDGSAATVRAVLTTRNAGDRHGKTSDLSRSELDDLCAFLLSL